MIEVVLDFKDIHSVEELATYLSDKLKFNRKFNGRSWDAYIDLFSDLLEPSFTEGYKDEDGWISYQEYLDFCEEDRRIGNKNEEGLRDDILLKLVNFYPFHCNHTKLADNFLHSTLFAISRCYSNNSCDGLLKVKIHIEN